MILRIEQKTKDLYEASFQIITENRVAGEAVFKGRMGSMDGVWDISFMGRHVSMQRVSRAPGKSFRPYSVSINGNQCGYVYQTDYKTGFLKPRIYHHRLDMNGQIADMFPIGFGDNVKSPVFVAEKQVSLVEKDLTVYNDLNVFEVFALNEGAALQTVLLSLYMYTIGYYKAGERPIKTEHKGYVLSKEKELLAKFDPNFKSANFPQ